MSMPIQVDTTMMMAVVTGGGLPRPLKNNPFPQRTDICMLKMAVEINFHTMSAAYPGNTLQFGS